MKESKGKVLLGIVICAVLIGQTINLYQVKEQLAQMTSRLDHTNHRINSLNDGIRYLRQQEEEQLLRTRLIREQSAQVIQENGLDGSHDVQVTIQLNEGVADQEVFVLYRPDVTQKEPNLDSPDIFKRVNVKGSDFTYDENTATYVVQNDQLDHLFQLDTFTLDPGWTSAPMTQVAPLIYEATLKLPKAHYIEANVLVKTDDKEESETLHAVNNNYGIKPIAYVHQMFEGGNITFREAGVGNDVRVNYLVDMIDPREEELQELFKDVVVEVYRNDDLLEKKFLLDGRLSESEKSQMGMVVAGAVYFKDTKKDIQWDELSIRVWARTHDNQVYFTNWSGR